MNTEPTDIEVFNAVVDAFGHTPETLAGKAEQINLALSTGDSSMVAAVVFDQAKDCRVPMTTHDPNADEVFPYPDLAPFGNHGLAQFMEALAHLGMQMVVKPIAK
jgi:hypothetical protein